MGPRPRISASRSHAKWEGTAMVPGTTQRSKERNFRLRIYSLQLQDWNVIPPGAMMASWIETEHPMARKGISWEFPLWKVNDASTRSKQEPTSSVAVVVSQFCFDSSLSLHGNKIRTDKGPRTCFVTSLPLGSGDRTLSPGHAMHMLYYWVVYPALWRGA